ncbi:MAG: hypothetical protein KBA61_03430 [Spirochaetes bacterium]|nr:hypothetical protein [Spirochaetota bacterium]
MKIKKKKLAKMCGLTPQALSMAKSRGQLSDDHNGLINLDDARAAAFLRAHGRAPGQISVDDLQDIDEHAGHAGRCALDVIPQELRDRTIPEILRAALPSGGRSIPPAVWIFLWKSIKRAELFAHDGDPEKLAFENMTGLPWATSGMTLQQATGFVLCFENSLTRPPHWTYIFRELCSMFGINNF